jgi:hypothetical protein
MLVAASSSSRTGLSPLLQMAHDEDYLFPLDSLSLFLSLDAPGPKCCHFGSPAHVTYNTLLNDEDESDSVTDSKDTMIPTTSRMHGAS